MSNAYYLRFEGRVGISAGLAPPTAYSDFLNFEKIEITAPEQETEKLISRMTTTTYGSALDSQHVPTDAVASVSLEFSTMTRELLALALGGSVTTVTQTGAGVVDEAITTALNIWVKLANRNIVAAGLVLEVPNNTTIDAAMYEVDLKLGMVKAIHANAVGTGVISYTKAAVTHDSFAAGLAGSGYVHLVGQATEGITGLVGDLDIWRANLAPSGAFDIVAGGHYKGALSGDLITPSYSIDGAVQTTPWRWRVRTA